MGLLGIRELAVQKDVLIRHSKFHRSVSRACVSSYSYSIVVSLACIVYDIKRDIGRKLRFFCHTTSEFRRNCSCAETRMVGLREGEKRLRIRLAVSTKHTNVTDGRRGTDRPAQQHIGRAMHSVARLLYTFKKTTTQHAGINSK